MSHLYIVTHVHGTFVGAFSTERKASVCAEAEGREGHTCEVLEVRINQRHWGMVRKAEKIRESNE